MHERTWEADWPENHKRNASLFIDETVSSISSTDNNDNNVQFVGCALVSSQCRTRGDSDFDFDSVEIIYYRFEKL